MPQRRSQQGIPREFLSRGVWPDGQLKKNAPVAAIYAKAISANLRTALGRRAISSVSEAADVARSTIYDILGGNTWPDVVSLAKLEATLSIQLWPKFDKPKRTSPSK
jgi:DNA-binding phage protein